MCIVALPQDHGQTVLPQDGDPSASDCPARFLTPAQRRQRANPRVVKRKMSKFMKKRPLHRGIKPLQRHFEDTIVIQPVAQPAGST